jgi:YfiH family protein
VRLKEKDGIRWLEFKLLADFKQLRHGVFLRHGGCSSGPFSSLNFGFFIGDPIENVRANIEKIKGVLGISHIMNSDLKHGKRVVEVSPHNLAEQSECDALTTSYSDIGLMMTHADCQAAIFYDPVKHAVANVHAGWRGSVQNIYAETVQFMNKTYGSKACDLLVGISPSLGPKEAEFINYRKELPEHFWKYKDQSNFFDFWAISEAQLIESGVLAHHIELAGIGTLSNPQDFFSYRRDKITGRHATLVALKGL